MRTWRRSGAFAAQAEGPWWSLLREAVQEYAMESGGAELPVAHFIDWLAEWGCETRRRQSGLLLLSAHRAKGLEFDHVAVLDGGWDKMGRNEDRDAPRRLFYVAMTRARQTLTLARFDTRHAMLDGLPEASCLLRRTPGVLPAPMPELGRCYQRLGLKDVDLGFAGRHATWHRVHRAIGALSAGSALALRKTQHHWELADSAGETVGRLSRTFSPPANTVCVPARVAAIIVWRQEDSEPEYRAGVQCERWEVVLPELVFEASR